jgi:hypothetical protein
MNSSRFIIIFYTNLLSQEHILIFWNLSQHLQKQFMEFLKIFAFSEYKVHKIQGWYLYKDDHIPTCILDDETNLLSYRLIPQIHMKTLGHQVDVWSRKASLRICFCCRPRARLCFVGTAGIRKCALRLSKNLETN